MIQPIYEFSNQPSETKTPSDSKKYGEKSYRIFVKSNLKPAQKKELWLQNKK